MNGLCMLEVYVLKEGSYVFQSRFPVVMFKFVFKCFDMINLFLHTSFKFESCFFTSLDTFFKVSDDAIIFIIRHTSYICMKMSADVIRYYTLLTAH